VFTGIIECVGRVAALEPRGGSTRLVIEAPAIAREVAAGESVSVNGGCLTVTAAAEGRVSFDAVPETLARTALGALRVGSRVNLERALRAGGRLDGHIVQGHVDGVGRVREVSRRGEDVRLSIGCDAAFHEWLVEKGSVAVDGVSLTVAGLDPGGFEVALIPYTLAETTLGERRREDRVNLEADVLGKYVKRYLNRILPARASG
jgi:riboflavin synthase alpha subunit